MPDTQPLIDQSGQAHDVPIADVAGALDRGWRAPTAVDSARLTTEAAREADYGGGAGAAKAALYGGARGASLGLSDIVFRILGARPEDLQGYQQQNPKLSLGAEVAGGLVPAFGAAGSLLAKTPAGAVSGIGKAIVEATEGAGSLERAGATAGGAAAEGALYGGGQYLSQVAIEDKPLAAEGFLGAMGKGALWAAPVGGALSLGGDVLTRAKALFPRSQVTKEAARAVDQEATSALSTAVRDGDTMLELARQRIAQTEAKTGASEAAERASRTMFGAADPAAMENQVVQSVDKAKLTEAADRYTQAKARLEDWVRAEADPDLERALLRIRQPELQVGGPLLRAPEFGEVVPPQSKLPDLGEFGLERTSVGKRSALGTPGPHEPPRVPATSDLPPLPLSGPDSLPPLPVAAHGGPASPREAAPARGGTGAVGKPDAMEASTRSPPLSDDEYAAYKASWSLAADQHYPHELFYSKGGDEIVNPALRSGKPLDERAAGLRDGLDAAFQEPESRIPRPTTLYRGVSDDHIKGVTGVKKRFENVKPGDVIEDPAYTSTTYSETAKSRNEEVVFTIHAPAGTPALPIRSQFSFEGEMLLPRGTRFRVNKVEYVPVSERWQVGHESFEILPDKSVRFRNKDGSFHVQPPIKDIDVSIVGDFAAPATKSRHAVDLSWPIDKLSVRQLKERQGILDKRFGEVASGSDEYKRMADEWDVAVARMRDIESGKIAASERDWAPVPGGEPRRPGALAAASPVPAQGDRDSAIASGRARVNSAMDKGYTVDSSGFPHLDVDAQESIRAGLDDTAKSYGMHHRIGDAEYGASVLIDHPAQANEALKLSNDRALGQLYHEATEFPGLVVISPAQARAMRVHASLTPEQLTTLGKAAASGDEAAQSQIFAAHAMHHESLHGFGPHITPDLHSKTIEELTTELAARRITSDMHGVPSTSKAASDAYDQILDPIVDLTAKATGTSRDEAYRALEDASLKLKAKQGELSSDHAIHFVADEASATLGKPAAKTEIAQGIYKTSREVGTDPPPAIEASASKAPAPTADDDDLLAALRGTETKLSVGSDLGTLSKESPAAAGYATKKLAQRADDAAHFRTKAVARNYEGSAMAAAEREAQDAARGEFFSGLAKPKTRDAYVAQNIGRAMREEGSHAAALAKVEREWAALSGVAPAEVAKEIVDRSVPIPPGLHVEDDAIQKALRKHNGKNVDIGADLGRAAKAIGDVESALAGLVDALGPDAPATAVAHAKAFQQALAAQVDAMGASAAKAASDITSKLKVQAAADKTIVDSDIVKALRKADSADSGAANRAVESLARREAKAAGAATAAPAAPLPSRGRGALTVAADIGTALEVLNAMGVHVPDARDVPVIGPVLSLYLKARAVMGILGRKGGSIGRSTESVVASKSAALRDRVSAATHGLLDIGSAGMRKAPPIAGPAGALGYRLFPGDGDTKSKDPRTLYDARMGELGRALQPGAIENAVADRIRTGDAALQDAIAAQTRKGIEFIASKAPRESLLASMIPGDGKWHPSKAALERWSRYIAAVHDPAGVLEDLAHGHVTAEGAETLRVVYPKLYAEAQRILLEHAVEFRKTLPYSRRVSISIMYQIPVDGTMSPQHMQYLATPASGAQPAGPTAPMPQQPAITAPLQLGQQTLTSLERRAGG